MNNLTNLINQSNYKIIFLCVDKFLDIKLPHLNNFYCLQAPPHIKNSGQLLASQIKEIQKNHQAPIAIMPFKPSAKIDFLAKKHNFKVIANDFKLNRFLEDKIEFYKFCKKYRLPTIVSSIDKFNQKNFAKYSQGKTIVIQSHFGWAGNSTFSSNNFKDIKNKILPNTIVKYSPLLSGYSITNNCCLTRFGLIQSPPALQYTGLKPYTDNPFTTVGRQWPAFISPKISKKIKQLTNKFGKIIKKMNYKGYFGLDFFVTDNKVYLLECNPRLTASFAFYHQLEEKEKINSLIYFHILEFLDIKYKINIKQEQKRFDNKSIIGSEIIKRNKDNKAIKKINKFTPLTNSCENHPY
jgi:predicted ATP-grasp superfamily ATP-dependent carboligase